MHCQVSITLSRSRPTANLNKVPPELQLPCLLTTLPIEALIISNSNRWATKAKYSGAHPPVVAFTTLVLKKAACCWSMMHRPPHSITITRMSRSYSRILLRWVRLACPKSRTHRQYMVIEAGCQSSLVHVLRFWHLKRIYMRRMRSWPQRRRSFPSYLATKGWNLDIRPEPSWKKAR